MVLLVRFPAHRHEVDLPAVQLNILQNMGDMPKLGLPILLVLPHLFRSEVVSAQPIRKSLTGRVSSLTTAVGARTSISETECFGCWCQSRHRGYDTHCLRSKREYEIQQ